MKVIALAAVAALVAAPAANAGTVTVAPHCAGVTVDAAGWPANSRVSVRVSRPRGAQVVRVDKTFTDVDHEKVGFTLDQSANIYRVEVTPPLGTATMLAGTMTACNPLYPNQKASVVPMPADWITSGGFTG